MREGEREGERVVIDNHKLSTGAMQVWDGWPADLASNATFPPSSLAFHSIFGARTFSRRHCFEDIVTRELNTTLNVTLNSALAQKRGLVSKFLICFQPLNVNYSVAFPPQSCLHFLANRIPGRSGNTAILQPHLSSALMFVALV